MKHLILLFMAVMLQLIVAQAQPEHACIKLDKILTAILKHQESPDLIGEYYDESLEYDTYQCTQSFIPDNKSYIYTAAEETIPIAYDERLCDNTSENNAEAIYFDYYTALKKCMGDKLQETVNPASKSGEVRKMAVFQATETLAFKLLFYYDHDEMSLDPLAEEDYHVFISVGEL